jgi:hypothetical protein
VENGLDTQVGAALDVVRMDLAADGWDVTVQFDPGIAKKHIDGIWDQANGANAVNLKNYIISQANNLKGIILLGHVTVPYSGMEPSDGHYPDPVEPAKQHHQMAWTADAFYGDVSGPAWTQIASGTDAGKFADDTIPSSLEIPIGRIDFALLGPSFPSELTLLQQYLTKDHTYRIGGLVFSKQAVFTTYFLHGQHKWET